MAHVDSDPALGLVYRAVQYCGIDKTNVSPFAIVYCGTMTLQKGETARDKVVNNYVKLQQVQFLGEDKMINVIGIKSD